jgi:AcrR family transcriptional regulator
VSTNRPYRSTLREEQAQETRLRIRKSARRLFAAQGFTETTINQIADDAGVAPQTIYAVFGSKGAIVGEMLQDLETSADIGAWVAKMIAEGDPRRQL